MAELAEALGCVEAVQPSDDLEHIFPCAAPTPVGAVSYCGKVKQRPTGSRVYRDARPETCVVCIDLCP